ncbi:MAG: SAM-dependent methyltransferase [Planctomycetaceae bacterium]|nr:SAM-dependent methyltransferase [Planctomycetaceae bacterium]
MNPDHRAANLASWDERVSIHLQSDLYDVEGFVAGKSKLRPFELEELGEVTGLRMAHLQCHFGLDTLSWAREGAIVTGLDFSPAAIQAARALAARTGIDATFVVGDVLDAAAVLDGPFDVVYTGLGAICWIDDLERWSRQIAGLLEPGGILYLAEFHPLTDIFNADSLTVTESYFDDGRPYRDEASGTYADRDTDTENNLSYSWTHPISTVLNHLLAAGFSIERMEEHDFTLFPRFKGLVNPHDDIHRFPDGHPRLPMMYSLRAIRT